MNTFQTLLEKQNNTILVLEKRLEVIDIAHKKTETDDNEESRKAATQRKEKFECELCDFKANSKQGLGVHMKRKHTKYTNESFPNICEICEEEFKDFVGKPWSKVKIESHIRP